MLFWDSIPFHSLMSCCSSTVLCLITCHSFLSLPFIHPMNVYWLKISYSSEKDPNSCFFPSCLWDLIVLSYATMALAPLFHFLIHVPPLISWEDLQIRDYILPVFEFLPLQQYLTHSTLSVNFIKEWVFWKLNVKGQAQQRI